MSFKKYRNIDDAKKIADATTRQTNCMLAALTQTKEGANIQKNRSQRPLNAKKKKKI